MKAVYKKELKAYFQSIIGCVFIAFLIAFTGIYFMAYNMTTGYPYFSYTLSGSLIVFIVGIPLITMRSFAEERKNKTDQILLTAPVSLWKVVVGKYLAMVTVIAIPNLIFCIFPLIIKLQGTAYLTVDYISILMFFLLGCVFAAIGMLLSALTESQIIAYIGTFGIFLILYLWDGILSLFPNTAMSGLVFIILLILLAAFYIWRMTNSFSIAGGVGCVGVAVAIAVYFLKETLYENLFTESLGGFALTNIFTDITQNSIVDVSGIVLYLSMITLFLFLTVQSIRRRLWESAAKKHGAYSVTMTAVFLAITVVINLIACQIPEKFRKIDVSNTKIYEISDTTEDFLKEMDKEISMKIIAVKENTDERIVTFLSKYAALSNKIHMEWIDPVLHPSVLSEYETTENTIVISCEETGKNTTVSFDDILVMDQYSYYYYGSTSYTSFDGEGQLTSALNYVTGEETKKVYLSTGHGEQELAETITELMNKNGYELSEVNLLMSTSVPDDCDLLIVNAVTSDLTEDEKTMLQLYLQQGGKVTVLLGETEGEKLPNLISILSEYGMTMEGGYIADMTRCYQNNPYCIFPKLSVSGDLAEQIKSEMTLVMNTHGMTVNDPARDTITTVPFMSTSDQAFAVTEQDQKQGEYILGAYATETVSEISTETEETEISEENAEASEEITEDTEKESRLTVIAAGSLIDEQIIDTFTELENTQLFMNIMAVNFENVKNVSIEAKSLSVEYNAVQHAGLFGTLMIFGIPAVILISGFVVWYRRRKA